MSYDIRLTDPVTGETLQLDSPHEMRGGTYQHGGTADAWLNITYNYGPIYRRIFKPVCSGHPEHIRHDRGGIHYRPAACGRPAGG